MHCIPTAHIDYTEFVNLISKSESTRNGPDEDILYTKDL